MNADLLGRYLFVIDWFFLVTFAFLVTVAGVLVLFEDIFSVRLASSRQRSANSPAGN